MFSLRRLRENNKEEKFRFAKKLTFFEPNANMRMLTDKIHYVNHHRLACFMLRPASFLLAEGPSLDCWHLIDLAGI